MENEDGTLDPQTLDEFKGLLTDITSKLDASDERAQKLQEEVDFLRKQLNAKEANAGRPGAKSGRKSFARVFVERLQAHTKTQGEIDWKSHGRQLFGAHVEENPDEYRRNRKALSTTTGADGLIDRDVDTDIAYLDRFRRPFLQDLMPTVRVSTGTVKTITRDKRYVLKATLAANIAINDPTATLTNTEGVAIGSTLTFTPGVAGAENLIVSDVDHDTNVVTFASNATKAHTSGAKVISDRYAPTGELKALPETEPNYVEAELSVVRIGAHVKISGEALEDADRLEDELEMDLEEGLELSEEAQILNGSGSNNEMEGILSNSDVPVYLWSSGTLGDNRYDAIRRGASLVYISERMPEVLVINPADCAELEVSKGTDGHYIKIMEVLPGGEMRVWRLMVMETTVISSGVFLIGNFSQGARRYLRREFTIDMTNADAEDFAKGIVTIRITKRAVVHVREPKAFVHGKWDSAPS